MCAVDSDAKRAADADMVVGPVARYFGTDLEERELLPCPDAETAPARFRDRTPQLIRTTSVLTGT
ncbi:hypothetical protein GCM10022282_26640 [Agromyces indicus]